MSKNSEEELTKMENSLKNLEISRQRTDYNESVPINRLPIEVFCSILKHLEHSDLFLCELVCKKWCYSVKAVIIRKLVIARNGKLRPRHWFFLDELCSPKSVMVKDTLDIKLVENSFMFRLKQLKICDPMVEDEYADQPEPLAALELINQLINLEVLEVSRIYHYEKEQVTISLPNLKHLAIKVFYPDLLLDCPKLASFKTKAIEDLYNYHQHVNFMQPLSITHLYLDEFFDKNFENLKNLKNLEYLSVSNFHVKKCNKQREEAKEYAKKIFEFFPNLKEISLRPDSSACFMVSETLVNLLNERTALKRENVALTFYGIRIETKSQLEYQQTAPSQSDSDFLDFLSELYMKNHSKLCEKELRWTRRIGYSGLLDYSQNDKAKILADLAEKLDYVEEVRVSKKVQDEDQLIDFLNGLKRFNSLSIDKEAQLEGSFYRKLAATCSKPWLTIRVEPQDGFTDLNYVFKFKNLVGFKTRDFDASDDFVRRLFDHFGAFQFEHQVERDRVSIMKKSRSRFEFSVYKGHLEIFDNLDELLQKVNKYCRGFNDENDDHICDCGCEFVYCPYDSYNGNLHKEHFNG